MTRILVALLLSASAEATGRLSPTSDVSGNRVRATGASQARSLADHFADRVNVKDFGAVGNNVADDTAAIQGAIDYAIAHGFPEVVLPGQHRITSTIVVEPSAGNTVRLRGAGPGYQQATLNWAGGADVPILRIKNCIGCVVEEISLQRRDAGAGIPSSAVSLYQDLGHTSQHDTLRNLKIGTQSVYPVAVNGIHVEGPNNYTNSEHVFDGILINGASGSGIRFTSIQNANAYITETVITNSGYGIYAVAPTFGYVLGFAGNGVDLYFPVNDDFSLGCHGKLDAWGFWSEGSGRLAEFAGLGTLRIRSGDWQFNSGANADGRAIYATNGGYSHTLVLEDFGFGLAGSPPATRYIDLSSGNAAHQRVQIIRPTSWSVLNGGDGNSGLKMPGANQSQWQVDLDLPVNTGNGSSYLWKRVTHYHSSPSGAGSFGFDITHRDRSWSELGTETSIQTTDATVTPVATLKLAAKKLYQLHAKISATVATTGADLATYELAATLNGSASSWAWMDPQIVYTSASAGAATWAVTTGINGSTFLPEIRVKGEADKTINWNITTEMTVAPY